MRLILSVAAVAAFALPAAAATINIGSNVATYTVVGGSPTQGGEIVAGSGGFTIINNDTPFYTATINFTLPTGFTNGLVNITNLSADDRIVATLNGQNLLGAGIFGPGAGRFLFTEAGPAVDFTFENNGTQTYSSGTGLTAGLNTLVLTINNTNNGIFGDTLTGGPSGFGLVGTVTFDVAAVPAPASLALFGLGAAALGLVRRRAR